MAQEFSLEEALGKGTKPTTEFSLDEALGRAPAKDAGFSLGDIAKSFGIGAVGSTKALTDVAGAENVVSSKLGQGVESLQKSLTPERQAEMQRQAARMKAAEESGSILQEIKAGALNVAEAPLQSAAQAIGSFVPYLPALFASPIATAMGLTGRSLSAITAVAQQAPKVIGTAQGAGAVKGSIYDGVLRAEIEAGVNPEVAKQKAEAAQSYFGGNFDQIALGAGLGLAAGSTGVEKFLTSAGRAGAAPGVARRVAGATVAESLPEAAQGGQEKVAENIALQRAGYDVDTFKGVAGAATQEALTGALGAAPIAAMVRPEVKPPESVDTFEKEKEEFRKGFGKAEPVAAPTEERAAEPVEPPTQFPGGYTATRREVSRQEVPESFGIFAQGSDKPLTTVAKQDEVEKKLQSLTEIRQEEQARLLQESDKITKSIQDEQRKLEVMEATGQTDTDQYVQAKALLAQKEEEAGLKLQDINDKIASYSAPLSFAPIGSRVDVQNEFVVNRGDQPVGVFPTLEQAELTLREREPEAFKQAEVAARTQELEKTLKPMLAKFNLGDVGLNIVEQLENNAGGAYLDRLIKVSLEEANPIQTMRHESLHALKDLGFFTPQQWKALTEQANSKWIKEYLENQTSELDGVEMSRLDAYKKIGLTQQEIVEEAIADAFGAYDRGATPPPGMIAALFKKLKNFFANFGQALRGAGFESSDDIFQRVERGELKSRKPKVEPARKTEAKPKAEPKEEPKAEPEEKAEEAPKEAKPAPEKEPKQEKFSLAGEGVPMSTRKLMEQQTAVAQQDIGLNTEAVRGRFNNVRDIAKALNQQTLDQLGAMDRNKLTQDESTRIAEAIADEVAYQLQTSAKTGTGLGWYSNNYPNAVKRLAKRFPELGTNKHARSVFSALVAVTSNGERVAKNIDNAIKLYTQLRKGKPLVAMGNRRATALENNLQVIQDLLAEHGQDFEKVLLKEITVKEMNARLREMGEKTDGSYLANTVVPAAAVYFGPKLGAFYANLSGSEGYLTMDLWWTRSINRMRGLLIPKATEASIGKFRDMMEQPDATREEVTAATIPLRNKYEEYGWNSELEHLVESKEPSTKEAKPAWFKAAEEKAGNAYEQLLFEHNLEKMANTIYKNEFEMLEEAPFTATDRKFMYDAARKAQALLRGEGINLSLADIQAALWYYEKRLYEKLSGRKADDIGYEEAIIAQANQGSGRARPSVVFDQKPDRRDESKAEVGVPEEVRGQPASGQKFSLKTNTPAFKRWFGDSKVVDENGEPMVVYHSTYSDVNKFKTNFEADEYRRFGVHVGSLEAAQNRLGVKAAEDAANRERSGTAGANMMPLYVSIKNPLRLDENRSGRWGVDDIMRSIMERADAGEIDGIFEEDVNDYMNDRFDLESWLGAKSEPGDAGYDIDSQDRMWSDVNDYSLGERSNLLSAFMQQLGYDGIVYANEFEGGGDSYIAIKPSQIKSATGNIGTYDAKNPDIRYSLKNVAFPSVKAAKDAVAETEVPKTEEFKRFIAGNQWTDADGNPKVFYHATAREFFEFTPAGQSQAIFLADTPEEAETFGSIAEDRLRREIYRALGKDEKLTFFQNIVDAQVKNGSMSEKQGSDFMRQAKRKVPEYGDFGDIEQETYDALLDLSPTRMSIMPLYARAETPFEFENPDHVEQVMQWVANNTEYPQDFPDKWLAGMKGRIKQGLWQAIEDKRVQQAIRALGHDSFTVRENRNSPKNYAVYKPEQVKSVTGNIGDFSGESKDIRYSLKKVRYSDDRFEKLWNESMYTQNDAENSATGYLAFVHPMEFVRATTSIDYFDRLLQEKEPLDFNRLKAYGDVPFLSVSEKNGEWKITGHEGRHRMMALHDAGYSEVPVYIRLKAENAKSIPVKAVGGQFPNSVSSVLMIAEVEPLSYANKQKAMEKFTRMSSKVKYSLPNIPQQITDRIDESVFKRQEKGFIERMVSAIAPESVSSFRQRYLNRYNQMSVYDKKRAEQMGGAALLADQSAESAALMSDLGAGIAASAMGMGDRNGGIPVLRNGITTIDTSVKGLIASIGPLAAYGDPAVYQRYQYWAMVKRGQRLNSEGKLTGVDTADIAFAKMLEQKHPEFVSVQKDLIAFNNGLVQYMVDTGVLSKERGHEYTKYADYIPFYRQMDEGKKTLGPSLFQSLSGVRPPPKLKGKDVAEAPLADFLETMVRNTQSAIQAGVKNHAAQRAINVALQVKAPGMGAERLPTASTEPNVINVLEKGQVVSYKTPDPLLIDAMKSLNLSELPFMGILSAPADLLRNLVTKDPGFMMANLMRDSLSAWVTSGQKMTPIAGTVISFGKALTRNSPGFEAMQNAGIIGGYEFSANVEQSGFKLEEDLARKAGKRTDSVLLRPFKSVWDALETGTTASDAATRALIYERVLADTGNEAEALYRSLEVMNFHRKGNSALIRVLTAAVPFFNARLQGLDLFYRASTGNMNNKDAAAIQRQFFARGMTMMALSTAYWFMVSDDEEYKNQEQETRDNNWIIPAINARIPIPFEVGVLFKVIPERIVAYTFGDDTGQDLRDSLFRNAMSTFAFNPIPQTAKPIIEAAFNFNTFTWRPIVSEGMKDVDPQFQVGPSTSIVAKGIGQALGLSPMKVDHIIKGYTGTIGMYGIDTIDMVLDQFGDSPKPTKRFEQLPVIKRFALDEDARGSVTQYYQLKDAVDTTVRTMNLLEKQGESEEYVEYLTKNQGTLAFKDYIRDTEKTMKDLREMRNAVRISQMTGDEKRDALLEITKAENAVTSQIQTIKKAIASVQ
jgi:hypothetical protein